MRSSLVRYLVAGFALAAFLPMTTRAQTIPSPYDYIEPKQEVGPYGGWMSTGTGRFGFGPSGGPLMGARYAIELAGPLSLEGLVSFVDGTRDVIDLGRPEGDQIIGQAEALVTTFDARFRFGFTGRRSWHKLAPFLTAGGGIATDMSSSSELDATLLPADVFEFGTSFLATVGLGTRFFVTQRFALRGEGVFSLYQIDTPPGYSDPLRGFVGVSDGEWLGGTTFSLALLYRW